MTTQSSPEASGQTPRNILICRLSAHGDVAQTLPLLVALKRHDPDCTIGWLVETAAAPLLENHPLIDRLHVCPRKRWLKALYNPLRWPSVIIEFMNFRNELKAARYEASLDVQGLFKSAVWPWLAGIPKRYGYAGARERADRFYTHPLPATNRLDPKVPAIKTFLALTHAIGVPDEGYIGYVIPPVPIESERTIDELLAGLDRNRPLVAVAPFTRWESKHWLPEYWGTLIEGLLEKGMNVVVLGGPEDTATGKSLLGKLADHGRLRNLIGQTGWKDLYALFHRTDCMVGLDSAPLHIANAVGAPVIVGIFGPTAAGRTGPQGERHRMLTTQLSCQPCHEHTCSLKTQDCMRQITPEQVLKTVLAQVQANRPAGVGG